VPDIAATLQIPVGTAKSRLHRSIALMRSTLADIDPDLAPVVKGQFA
jgi:DNA-directed RNA polymerase specialized sigma24 family protein